MEPYALAFIIILAVAAIALGITVLILSINNNDNESMVYNVTFVNTVGEIINITVNEENGEIDLFELGAATDTGMNTQATVAIPRNSSVTFASTASIDLNDFEGSDMTYIGDGGNVFMVKGVHFEGRSALTIIG